MGKKFKVLLLENMDEKGIKFLEEKADISYVSKHDEETITKALLGKDAVIKRDRGFITKKMLEQCPTVKVVGRHGVGLDTIDVKGAEELGIYVVNTPYANVEAVAEHNIALMLAIAKPILKVDKTLREGNWDYGHYLVGEELFGKKVGFVGLGKIGYRTAEICKIGFNMDVYYHDLIRNKIAEEKLGVKFVSIEELCQISDFVVMALPLNKETEKYFDKEKFNLMKPSAFFINNSRGPIVDEEALINALKENKIAGAGIDVFTQEPPAKDNPLFKLDNVVVTPHSAANSKSAMVGMAMVAEDIIRILEGKEPKYPANNPKK
ncbi:hydroxyacid dehydrogenase [Candidatus Atribacteria bacterium HGW-Atribacteria-1]|nr:MAG: hydroxyacid dehydrogenase [Candidatus Atribacteria bacterium HGW-Atribacteria-1]